MRLGRTLTKREVLDPLIIPRVEQACKLASFDINSGKIRSFLEIALPTRKRKVLELSSSSVLFRDDVLDMKGSTEQSLRHPTVFAATTGSLPNLQPDISHQIAVTPV